MNVSRKNVVLAALAVVVAAASIFAGTGNGQAATKKQLVEIKTWTRKDCSLAPWLVTEKLGFFEQEGVKLVYTGETQAPLQIPSLVKGNNDVGSGHPNQYGIAIAGGAKLKAVVRAGVEPAPSYDPKFRHMWWFVNPAKHPNVKSFADLKNLPGKIKVSTITKNICADFETNILAEKYGVPKEKIEWVTMPDIQAIQALKQGLVDVAPVHPPFYKGMLDAKAIKVADSTDTGLGSAAGLSYYWFTEDFIKKHPEAVAGFVRAIKRGQRWANANPDKTAKWVEEVIGVPVTGNHYYSEDATIVEKEIVPWIKGVEDAKVIPKGKITPASIVTHQFEAVGNDDKAYQNKLKQGAKKKKA
ncbi:ABC transporter substrate-binding protein [Geomonas subterranea]|uniref:ABC transporter substrate-binding protein n=1 Tax=Geomonas subterranea TaxID=2847989 RepID=A0ABX8LH63_9BACT|nr:ABC transporter substrate-binding protein [Geomonas subterranea]QXE91368.1 ABC transporter substrate-binding protein [Geomonas subterranea]QXM10545.1 ABC transporter substrate-binding protein [Geomonas subterranea]